MTRNKIGRNYERALELAQQQGVDFDTDFHAQDAGDLLSEMAKQFGYRKPTSANGSTGRYFFQLLKRLYDKRSS